MALDMTDIEFVGVLSHDEFRDIVSRYRPQRLGPLRDALIAKSNDIQDQRMTPRSMKTTRDGSPMDPVQYEDWSAKARTAQNCTDRQIQMVTEQMRQPHNWGNGTLPTAIECVYGLARYVSIPDVGDENASMDLVRHYLDSLKPQRSTA